MNNSVLFSLYIIVLFFSEPDPNSIMTAATIMSPTVKIEGQLLTSLIVCACESVCASARVRACVCVGVCVFVRARAP